MKKKDRSHSINNCDNIKIDNNARTNTLKNLIKTIWISKKKINIYTLSMNVRRLVDQLKIHLC